MAQPPFHYVILRNKATKNLIRFIVTVFFFNSVGPLPTAHAQELYLPKPGLMVHLSPSLHPPLFKGIKVYPKNPLAFDFILNPGDGHLSQEQLKQESDKLIKYFLASLTVPEKDMWVNLSPYDFNIDPAMLKQLQNAPGLVPMHINIQPMGDLRQFLGFTDQEVKVTQRG